jgi:hypothetical protein
MWSYRSDGTCESSCIARLIDEPLTRASRARISPLQTAHASSFPRRVSAPRVSLSSFFALPSPKLRRVCLPVPLPLRARPQRGAGGAPGGGILIRRALVKARTTFARRGRPGQAGTGLSALQPWRFWARSPEPPGARLRAAARDTSPRSACGIVSGDAPHERGCCIRISDAFGSQLRLAIISITNS